MSKWIMVKLGEVATFINGYAFKPTDWGKDGVPIIRIQNLTGNTYETNCFSGKYNPKYEVNDGDILVAWSASLGVYEWNGGKALLNQHIFKVAFDKIEVSKRYFFYVVNKVLLESSNQTHGSTMKHITKSRFGNLLIPLPPLDEQKRIAEELDKISGLIAKRKCQLEKLDLLVKAKFVEMFGDPVTNPMGWDKSTLKQSSIRLSDGPFGSNLKSEHYSSEGVRVIRLQNIGVGKFINKDKAYVSQTHYETIKKYTCKAGDLVIATLGEPNLRTCIIPKEIPFAINKADCVHYIPNPSVLNSLFTCQYLNSPAILNFASDKMHGQTRTRISSGQVAQLPVFLPPINLQNQFADYVTKVEQTKTNLQRGLQQLETMYKARMQEFFA